MSIIPNDCSENYAVKDQCNSDGVKNMSIYLFYKITSSKYNGWLEQKTEK